MRDCANIRALLFEFASGKLDENLNEQVKNHIEKCEVCRREYKAQKFYFENLPNISEYLCDSQRDIKTPVMQKIKEEKETPPVYISRRFHFSYGTAASLVLVAALFIFVAKTGIVSEKEFTTADYDSFECTAEDTAYGEAPTEHYSFNSSASSGTTGAEGENGAYFSVNDTCDSAVYTDEVPADCVIMMSAPPADNAENECVTKSAKESTSSKKEPCTQLDRIPLLTIENLREIISEKGSDMTWSDFESYEHSNVGSGICIFHYPISEYLCLTISGVPDSEPFEIRLVSEADASDYITLPDGDIDSFINRIEK